jgi:hypothetical protein
MRPLNWLAGTQAAHVESRAQIVAITVGAGSGGECAYCHKPILREDVEYAVEAIVLGGPRTLHFHRLCHHIWESHE